jgi:hypothetical protein
MGTHRPLDPRICPIGIDANALNRDGSAHDASVDRLLELRRAGKINLIVPHGVRAEVLNPQTPSHVREAVLPNIFTIPTGLTEQEQKNRRLIAAALQGNAKQGKHAADAQHLADAAKYCGYFITHDERVLKRSMALRDLLPPSLNVVTLDEFMDIFDDYESGRRI